MFKRIVNTFLILLVHFYVISSVAENIGQLPHCVDNSGQGLLIVSTLDGKLSALNSSGVLKWQIDTGPEPLLKSNIHNVELTNNGEWIRLIPSLSGGLYKFNGKTIDTIPISGDSLLKSSFFYSHDLVIAGGKEVKTYGVSLHSGNVIYTCSLLGCQNETNFEGEIDSVLIIERNTLTVRAHEPRTGNERWNFSVGHHNIKVPSVSCVNTDNMIFSFNISVILPEGLVIASKVDNKNEILWQYKFDAPIVNVWLWNGRDLSVVDTFDVPAENDVKVDLSPAIYLAMHNKQLYIHESNKISSLQANTYPTADMIETKGSSKFPWNPIPASRAVTKTNDHDKTAALSVLYNSEYVNGNGYFLYPEIDMESKERLICNDNITNNTYKDDTVSIMLSLHRNWAYALVTIIMVISVYFLFGPKPLIIQTNGVVSSSISTDSGRPSSNFCDETEEKFISNYENSFETVSCLGKGGFGVVFEAKQKIDECVYAIKRITLPVDSQCQVLREVKALAQLDHRNIVRYYNSWFEQPPRGWCYQHDNKFIDDRLNNGMESDSYSASEVEAVLEVKHKRNNSTVIDMSVLIEVPEIPPRLNSESDIDICFRENSTSCADGKCITDNTVSFRDGSTYNSKRSSNSNTVCQNNDRPIYLYIQMQLCKRESLKDWLFNNSTRNKSVIIPIFKQILNAVEYIHSKGLIHRDLKPNNIFFSMDDDIKVGDFGLVTTMNENNDDLSASITLLQSHTKGAGTELYMSPEQIERKRYNYKVDIYSLGVILFELLQPFSTEMERNKKLTDLRNDKYPEDFSDEFPDEFRLLEKMLSRNPDVRPTTVEIKKTSPFTPTC